MLQTHLNKDSIHPFFNLLTLAKELFLMFNNICKIFFKEEAEFSHSHTA